MLYKFELVHNTTEATKNICYAKDEGAVDDTNQMVQKISCCKNLNNQATLRRPKTMDFKAVFKAREAILVSSTWRVSGELGILRSNMVQSKSPWYNG